MWWHRSALPSGLWVQRLSSGLTVRRVSSDGSQARGETEQEVQIHAPCGAERAHIQVRLMGRSRAVRSSSAHTGDVLGFKCTDCICEELWISGHSNVQINQFILIPANPQERRDKRGGEYNDFCDQMPVWRVCSSDQLRWNKADLHHRPGQQQSQTWHLLPQVQQTQRRPEVHCKCRVNHDKL